MNYFVCEYKNSLSNELCDKIINAFENEPNKHIGTTMSGVNKDIKDTLDYSLYDFATMTCKNDLWTDIDKILYSELNEKLITYINNLKNHFFSKTNDLSFNFFQNTFLVDTGFMIQKYTKNIGKYIYHIDDHVDMLKLRYRVITYIWYLNDVDNGGTTEFLGGLFEIKPERGKLIFFPVSWCFPHRGNIPISNDKYIITGWFYIENNKDIIDFVKNITDKLAI